MTSFVCCLCSTTLEKAAEWRNSFSESSRSVMPLLFKIVTSIYGKDLVRNVFQEDHSKVCRPCFRRLDRITKLDRELQENQAELTQQVKRLGDRVLSVTNSSTAAISAQSVTREPVIATPTRKRQQSTVLERHSPAKRARLQKLTPVRNIISRMVPKGDPKKPSPAVAVS